MLYKEFKKLYLNSETFLPTTQMDVVMNLMQSESSVFSPKFPSKIN